MFHQRTTTAACQRCSGHHYIRCPECRAMYQPWLSVGILKCPVCHSLGYVRCPDCREPRSAQVLRSAQVS